jgi:hypothetical protein
MASTVEDRGGYHLSQAMPSAARTTAYCERLKRPPQLLARGMCQGFGDGRQCYHCKKHILQHGQLFQLR